MIEKVRDSTRTSSVFKITASSDELICQFICYLKYHLSRYYIYNYGNVYIIYIIKFWVRAKQPYFKDP